MTAPKSTSRTCRRFLPRFSVPKIVLLFIAALPLALILRRCGFHGYAAWRSKREVVVSTPGVGKPGCWRLLDPHNGRKSFCTREERYGSICVFECDEGFSIRGSLCRTCQSNGRWSGYDTACAAKDACLLKPSSSMKKIRPPRKVKEPACCPAGYDGRRYDPQIRECCHAGRLHWRTPLSSHASRDCDCCARHVTKCWTCCDEPLRINEGLRKQIFQNYTTGAYLELAQDDFSDGFSIDLKVVGGSEASETLRKMNAYIMYQNTPWVKKPIDGFPPVCGGVLIHNRWVLTARHCIMDSLCKEVLVTGDFLRVIVGKKLNNFTTEGDGQARNVDRVVCHPHYCNNRKKPDLNDIALLRLSNRVDTNDDNVAIATLPLQGEEANNWRDCKLTGWGITEKIGVFPYPDYNLWLETYRNATPPVLQEVSVPIVANRRCRGRIRPCHLCAGALHRDGCNSDSGSPLFCQTKDERGGFKSDRLVVHGVFSSGTCGTRSNVPSVYARVSFYRDWIDDVIEGYK